jgi:hypothetical protein
VVAGTNQTECGGNESTYTKYRHAYNPNDETNIEVEVYYKNGDVDHTYFWHDDREMKTQIDPLPMTRVTDVSLLSIGVHRSQGVGSLDSMDGKRAEF